MMFCLPMLLCVIFLFVLLFIMAVGIKKIKERKKEVINSIVALLSLLYSRRLLRR